MKIQVLGMGCAKCKTLEEKIRSLNDKYTLNHEIEKITDLHKIMKYGIMMTPGLVFDGIVKSAGTIPSDEQLLEWMKGKQI